MVVTSRVRLDRISSSTRNAALPPEVIVGDEIVAAEGYVLAVRILEDKSTLQHRRGHHRPDARAPRRATCSPACSAPGARSAGYAGVVPTHIAVGDTIEVLNLGGILGRCTSVNPEIGPPFKAEVLGAILAFPELGDRVGRPAHIRDRAVPPADTLESRIPVVYVAGTCMNAGKTVAATELVRGLARGGLRVARGQAHRRLAHARRALDARRRRRRRAHVQRRRHREHACRRHRRHRQGDLQPARRRQARRDRRRAGRRHPRRVRRAGHPARRRS